MTTIDPPSLTAHPLQSDPWFMAGALTAFGVRRRMDSRSLADWLGCTPADLVHLSLCRRPGREEPRFDRAVAVLAAFAGCRGDRLAALLDAVAEAPCPR